MREPFAAGALSALSDPSVRAKFGIDIHRIVATSSGAMSGAYYAAAIQAGQEANAGARLAKLWIEEASFLRTFAPSLQGIVARRGLSPAPRLLQVFRRDIRPSPSKRQVDLRLVTTSLDGGPAFVAGGRVTAHEHVFVFGEDDFTTEKRLDRLFEVVAASAAFPGVFVPVWLRTSGRVAPFVDGGIVDNTAIGRALEGDPGVDRVFVIAPTPRLEKPVRPLRGFAYASQLADVLVNERLERDLRKAEYVNGALEALKRIVPDEQVRAHVLRALGWRRRRVVEVVEVRPAGELEGNAFAGWFSRRLRGDYVRAGRAAALGALERHAMKEKDACA